MAGGLLNHRAVGGAIGVARNRVRTEERRKLRAAKGTVYPALEAPDDAVIKSHE